MELRDAITKRRTVREFESKTIPLEILKHLLNLGFQAPSNSHGREWKFIIIDQPALRLRICGPECENLLRENTIDEINQKYGHFSSEQIIMYRFAVPKQARMLLDAGALIIPLYYNPYDLSHPTKPSHFNYIASMWMCLENILLSGVEYGIFGVTYILEHPAKLKTILQIPTKFEPACILALGYPTPNAKIFPPAPFHIEDKMYFNIWQGEM